MKIVLIGDQFVDPIFYRRWEVFAKMHTDFDVTLLTPKTMKFNLKKNFQFVRTEELHGKELNDNNFRIRLITRKKYSFGWVSPDFKRIITEINPDILYVGGSYGLHLLQIIKIRNRYLPNTKIISFSMRGPAYNLSSWKRRVKPLWRYLRRRFIQYYYMKYIVNYCCKYCDAILCHYPAAVDCFRDEGYKGPIYMQTQVGVNPELFHENAEWRKEIRDKYNLGNSYVFGSATRFVEDKGVDDIIEALPNDGDWKYIIMGSGTAEEISRIESAVKRKNLPGKIIMVGFIDLEDMRKYYNAIDCMIHVTHTSPTWQETFSIALAQCMITGKPIIGSDSGSIPYQLGPDGLFVHEGDISALREKIKWVLNNQEEAKIIGKKMFARSSSSFNIFRLNELFYRTLVEDIIPGKFDLTKADMVTYWNDKNENIIYKYEEKENH